MNKTELLKYTEFCVKNARLKNNFTAKQIMDVYFNNSDAHSESPSFNENKDSEEICDTCINKDTSAFKHPCTVCRKAYDSHYKQIG